MLLSILPYAALIGLFAVVYRHILAYEPVLSWWFQFGARFERKWFFKPIWGCELCIAGQIALWTYVLNWITQVILNRNGVFSDAIHALAPTYHLRTYSLLECFIFITAAIASAWLLYKGFDRLKEN